MVRALSQEAKRRRLAALRRRIGALENDGAALRPAGEIRWGAPEEPAVFKGSLAPFLSRAGLHDIRPETYLDGPAASLFAVLWLAQTAGARPLVWVRRTGEARLDFGSPAPETLERLGFAPERLVQVVVRSGADALWACEEALNAGAAVLGEAAGASAYDLSASRRLHAAARANGAQILILAAHDDASASAALTRWRLAPAPGRAAPWKGAGGLYGLSAPRFRAVLTRVRGGAPQAFDLEWSHDAFRCAEPAPLADRAPVSEPRRAAG